MSGGNRPAPSTARNSPRVSGSGRGTYLLSVSGENRRAARPRHRVPCSASGARWAGATSPDQSKGAPPWPQCQIPDTHTPPALVARTMLTARPSHSDGARCTRQMTDSALHAPTFSWQMFATAALTFHVALLPPRIFHQNSPRPGEAAADRPRPLPQSLLGSWVTLEHRHGNRPRPAPAYLPTLG